MIWWAGGESDVEEGWDRENGESEKGETRY